MRQLSSRCVTYFDCVRVLLAQLVVVGHAFGFYFNYWNGFFPGKFPYIQSVAVVGFFVVSGFLVCRSALSNIEYKGGDYVRYYMDRFARVYTTLIPCLAFVFVVDYCFSKALGGLEYNSNLDAKTLVNNILLKPSMPLGTMRPIWSLMYEWWIYILFGGLVFLRKNWFVGAASVCIGGYFTFAVNAKGEAGHLEVIWMIGALGAFYFDKLDGSAWARRVFVVAFACSVLMYMITLDAYNVLAGSLLSLSIIALAVDFNSNGCEVAPRVTSLFNGLAAYSFTLFLTHYSVLFWLHKLGLGGLSGFVMGVILSNVIAYLIAKRTEIYHKDVSHKLTSFFRRYHGKRS